jgi:hypothetical protein
VPWKIYIIRSFEIQIFLLRSYDDDEEIDDNMIILMIRLMIR